MWPRTTMRLLLLLHRLARPIVVVEASSATVVASSAVTSQAAQGAVVREHGSPVAVPVAAVAVAHLASG